MVFLSLPSDLIVGFVLSMEKSFTVFKAVERGTRTG